VRDEPTTGNGARGRNAHHRLPWITAAVLSIAVVLALVVYVPVRATSTSSYCSSCHQMKLAKASWQVSVHGSVACVSCHVPPGLGASMKWRGREWVNIWATYLHMGSISAKQHVPGNANCTSCHSLANLGTVQTDIRMPHDLHVSLRNLRCVDCHDKVSHAKPGQSTAVSMSVCSMCHSQTTQQSQCTFCHKTKPQNAHPADYIKLHGQEALANPSDCLRCHHDKASFCDTCHAKPTPDHFSGTWRYTHAASATADRAACLGCHSEKTFCLQCHQVDHPVNWVGAHGQVAAQGTQPCLVCHQKSFCDACHARSGVKT
jgi:nitrate/TMAO reductase-like tetraheme cytochrome c subunit